MSVTDTTQANVLTKFRPSNPDLSQLDDLASDHEELTPLSASQERIWFKQQISQDSQAYNIPAQIRVRGELHQVALNRALREIVSRHDSLRSIIQVTEQGPRVRTAFVGSVGVAHVDLRTVPQARVDEIAQSLGFAWFARPFDLTSELPMRVAVLRLHDHEYRILFSIHHFAIDGWSLNQIVDELGALYVSYAQGQPISLPTPAVQYRDFACWQSEQVSSGVWDGQLSFWKRQLEGLPPLLRLPFSRILPDNSSAGGTHYFEFSREQNRDVQVLCKTLAATPFVVLLAALKALLYRCTEQADLCIATAVSNRRYPGTENTVGSFANDLLLRTRVEAHWSYATLVEEVKSTVATALNNQDIPFHKVIEGIEIERSASASNPFQIFFILHQQRNDIRKVGELSIELQRTPNHSTRFDLAIEMNAVAGQYSGFIEFRADLFDSNAIERLVAHLQLFIAAAAAGAARPLHEYGLLTEQERCDLARWNATDYEYPNTTLYRLFELQAQRTPDAIALMFGEDQVTYRELDAQANRLAQFLRREGVVQESLVGVLLDRSIQMIVSVLAILKAGGAYVPLDPSYPPERLAFMAQDAALSLVLTTSNLVLRISAHIRSIQLDLDPSRLYREECQALTDTKTEGQSLVYVIYTSGSTGRPKGAMNTDGGVRNRILWMQSMYRLGPDDRVLFKTPYSFDVSVWEIFWPLVTGAAMVIAAPAGHQDTGYIAATIRRYRVTTLHFVPSMLSIFLDEPAARSCTSLRRVICSGEALSPGLRDRFLRHFDAELHNLYGPTEAAVDVSFWKCDRRDETVPIGRPIHNIQLYVLDKWLQPVPAGIVGEIFIGGVGLARGYYRRPRETANAFVPDPFHVTGGRLYRTGDLGKFRLDGAIEYVGRNDHQLKIRGCRVEVGEVESCIGQHEGVGRAIVLPKPDAHGEKQLIAYIIPREGVVPAKAELLEFAAAHLPSFMVPAAFVFVERLRLAAHGKIDYSQLPLPTAADWATAAPHVEPQGKLQQQLAALWMQVLAVVRVGANDNFFALGGNSMLALRLVTRARRAGLAVSVADLFRLPTIRKLADHLAQTVPDCSPTIAPFALIAAEDRARLPPDVEDAYPLTALQLGMIYHAEDAPDTGYFHNIDAYRLQIEWNEEVFGVCLRELTRLHPILRTSFDLHSCKDPIQIVHPAIDVPVVIRDLRSGSREQSAMAVQTWMKSERETPIDVTCAPLLRITVHRLTDDELIVGITHHHAILDGWSLNALMLELATRYRAKMETAVVTASIERINGSTAFRDYVALERAATSDHASIEHWRNSLGDAVALRISSPAGAEGFSGERFGEQMHRSSPRTTQQLAALARSMGMPLKSLLLAAHVRVMAMLCGLEDVTTGVVTDCRPENVDPDTCLGLFLNTLALRVKVDRTGWRELIGRVFASEQGVLRHRCYPFAHLKQQLEARAIPTVLFNYIDFSEFRSRHEALGLRINGGTSFVRTPGTLVATFDADANAGINIVLHFDRDTLSNDAASVIGAAYLQALNAIASGTDEWNFAESLNAVGLIQLQAPPAAFDGHAVEESVRDTPATVIEEAMQSLWGEVLGVERPSVEADFFALGGTSLKATQLMARVRSAFEVEVGLGVLFEQRTIRGLSEQIGVMQGRQVMEELPRIEVDELGRYEPFEMTEVQQAYWVGRDAAFELGSVAAHGYMELEFERLDVDRLQRALRRLIEHHDMLRVVMLGDGRQRVLEQVPGYVIEREDLSGCDEEYRARQLLETRERMSHQVLAADRWPLFELRASELATGRVRLHISVDVLMADGWSFQLLAQQLWRVYEDEQCVLAPLSIRFRDYVKGLERLKQTQRYAHSLRYWRERLEELPSAPQLPVLREGSTQERPRFERWHGEMATRQWGELKREAARRGLTGSTVVLSAYAAVLGHYSRHQRFTLNLTLFNRLPLHEQVDELVGDFTSTLLLEVKGQGHTLRERARALQDQLWRDLDQRYVSGVQVLRELAREQGRAGGAVMPVVFTSALDMTQKGESQGAVPAYERVYGLSQTPQVWLDLQVFEQAGALHYNLDAVQGLFAPGVLQEMFALFEGLLERWSEESGCWEQPIQLERVPEWIRLSEPAIARTQACLYEGFIAQAHAHPRRLAVRSAEQELSYAQLERSSAAVGLQLQQRGVGRGELVGVLAPKGVQQIIAVLGIVRAGAGYLPLDPELPEQRIEQLLQAAQPQWVLVDDINKRALPRSVQALQIAIEPHSDAVLRGEPSAEDLAYVIYTSGSTGTPKGVSMTHGAALTTVAEINERFALTPTDRVLGLSALSFDLSVYDIFGVLGAAGALVLPAPGRDPAQWWRTAQEQHVTIWNSVPSSLQMLLEYVQARGLELPAHLRLILLSGDWIPVELAARVRRLAPQVQLISLGGATEAGIWSICYPIEQVDPRWRSIPYGKALRDQHVYVLNESLEHCPVWVSGEIYIAGAALAQGYWRDPQRTAERFIEHPHTHERLYRTGDLGRYLPDGNIEFLGREDTQVKVSGYRIELGEIEAALSRHEEVKEVAVIAKSVNGTNRLIAYIAPHTATLHSNALRAFVATRLPEYMIPSRFVLLPELPRTANGKLNRRQLAAAVEVEARTNPGTSQSTPLDEVLLEIWKQLLGITQLTVEDNFFELGGNSVIAMQLIGQMQRVFKVPLSLADFFAAPTISALVTKVRANKATEDQQTSLPTLAPDAEHRFDPFPLTDIQEAYWIGRQSLVDLGGVSTHAYAEIDATSMDIERLQTALRKIIDRHDMLRAVVLPNGEQQVLRKVPAYELEILDLSTHDQRAADEKLLALRAQLSHQVRRSDVWPLFDMRATVLPGGSTRLHISADILIADAWSFQLAVKELFQFYENSDQPLPTLNLTFRDYVLAERRLRSTAIYSSAQRYWHQRLPTLPPAPALPLLLRPGTLRASRFARVEGSLGQAEWTALKGKLASKGLTPSGFLCALYAEVLAMWSSDSHFTINVTVFNRLPLHEQSNLLVGDFTSTLLLEVAWRAATFEERARELQQQLWRDLEHRVYSGVQVLRDLRRQKSGSSKLLMPVVFTSTLGAAPAETSSPDDLPWRGASLYAISQTPQVLLDYQVSEQGGALRFNWDFVRDAFQPGLIEDMFAAYSEKLGRASSEQLWNER